LELKLLAQVVVQVLAQEQARALVPAQNQMGLVLAQVVVLVQALVLVQRMPLQSRSPALAMP
jgi:hypothetical protein